MGDFLYLYIMAHNINTLRNNYSDDLLWVIQTVGVLKASRSVNGINNLNKIMDGIDYLTKDIMLKTIVDVLTYNNIEYFTLIDPVVVGSKKKSIKQIEVVTNHNLHMYVYNVGYKKKKWIGVNRIKYEDINVIPLKELYYKVVTFLL
jgi:hypothetical protein